MVTNIKKVINEQNYELNNIENSKLQIATKIGSLKSENITLENNKNLFNDLNFKLKLHTIIANAFSKNGIPNNIIQTLLPLINNEISNILSNVVDFTIEFTYPDLDIYIIDSNSKRLIEMASGMEKLISSLAIRVALTNITSLPKSDFFIIDEGFGSLDNNNIESCNTLLTILKKYYRFILVVTHVDGIKENADIILEINRINNFNQINYVGY